MQIWGEHGPTLATKIALKFTADPDPVPLLKSGSDVSQNVQIQNWERQNFKNIFTVIMKLFYIYLGLTFCTYPLVIFKSGRTFLVGTLLSK